MEFYKGALSQGCAAGGGSGLRSFHVIEDLQTAGSGPIQPLGDPLLSPFRSSITIERREQMPDTTSFHKHTTWPGN